MLAEGFWHLAVWTWDHFKSLLWSIESYHYFFFPYMTRIQCYWSLLPEAIKPPAASFTVKCRRENWAFKLRWREGAPFFFFFTDFLEGAQVSGRWQQDETQRQPGESLEGEPGSGSSQVLSWSALDKREAASLHMLLIAMPDHKEVLIDSLPLSLEGIWDSWRRNKHFLGKTVWNCVESRKLSQLAICQLLLRATIWKKKSGKMKGNPSWSLHLEAHLRSGR